MNFYNFDNNTEDNFYDKNYSEIDNASTIINDVLKKDDLEHLNNENNRLTHNDCVLIYLNPNISSKKKFDKSVSHVQNCSICQKKIIKDKNKKNDNISVSFDEKKKKEKKEKPIFDKPSNDNYQKMMNEEQNLKYQNLLLETSMNKYFENMDEKKKLNDNINRILNLLNDNSRDQHFVNNKNDNFFLYICFFVVILLLIVDIILKIKI